MTFTTSSVRARFAGAALLLPVLATAVLVGWQAGRPQLWRDEFATWSAATRPLAALDRLTAHLDGVIEPYYRLMHAWIGLFGDSAVALRAPSILAAAVTAGLVGALAAVLGSRRAGVLAGLVYAALPSTIRYGQEARPYALAESAAVAATLLLILALRRRRWFLWAGYAGALAVLGALHLVMLLVLAGHLVVVLDDVRATRSWRSLLAPGAAVLAAAAAVSPLALRGYAQTGAQLGSSHHTTFYLIAELPVGVCCGVVAAVALLVPAAAGVLTAGRAGLVFALLVLAPVAALALVATVIPVFNHRYVLFVAPLACVLAGLGLARLSLPPALGAAVLLAGITLPEQGAVRRSHEQSSAPLIDYRSAARIVAAGRRPGDTIVYQRQGPQLADVAVEYYLRGGAPRDVLAAASRDAAGSFWTPQVADPAVALTGVSRVWAVVPDTLGTHRPQALPADVRTVLAGAYRQTGRWRVDGITVLVFERPAAAAG